MTRVENFTDALNGARWEIVPVRDPQKAIDALPATGTVTVGCFAKTSEGYEQTLAVVSGLARDGYNAVPHIPARSFESAGHARDVLSRYRDAGVSEVFVVAGNAEQPHGPFDGALDVLRLIADGDWNFHAIGVAAYPEGHPDSAFDYYQGLQDKAEIADYCVTQVCFDATAILAEAQRITAAGVDLPMHVGVPGVIAQLELLRLSRWMGIGSSMKFIKKQKKLASRLLRPTDYNPETLIAELIPHVGSDGSGIAGLHLNTFNQVARTMEWITGTLGERVGSAGIDA